MQYSTEFKRRRSGQKWTKKKIKNLGHHGWAEPQHGSGISSTIDGNGMAEAAATANHTLRYDLNLSAVHVLKK